MKKMLFVLAILMFGLMSVGVNAQCVAPPSGLVSWWPGDGNANDIQDSNHGILENGAAFTAGLVGQAFDFNGANSVLVPHSGNLMPTALTVDAWVFLRSYPGFKSAFVEKVDTAQGGYDLEVIGNIANAVVWNFGTPQVVSSLAPLPLNTWTHLAMTFDGITLSLYVNGVLQGSRPAVMTPTTAGLTFSRASSGNFFNVDGMEDEIELFDRALAQTEIQDIFNAGSAGKCKTALPRAPNADNAQGPKAGQGPEHAKDQGSDRGMEQRSGSSPVFMVVSELPESEGSAWLSVAGVIAIIALVIAAIFATRKE